MTPQLDGRWSGPDLVDPVSRKPLRQDGHALSDGATRWPVIDGIPFLRTDRRALADRALERLDDGDAVSALVLLLGDQDNWARSAPPDEGELRALVASADAVSFRDAMALLAFGPVSTYFQHRWSDPTFLSGLALAEAHWRAPRTVLELACGAGHFLREFGRHADSVIGGDLVFAKLWLARHFVSPDAHLVCFDAASPWPFADGTADLTFCHDAFYFLPDKPAVASEMRRVTATDGTILVGHTHNRLVETLSSGAPLSPSEYAALFATDRLYDDRELTAALVDGRAPVASPTDALASSDAVALAAGRAAREPAGAVAGLLALPPEGTRLRRNPLYVEADGAMRVAWPSERYEREYGGDATYPPTVVAAPHAVAGEPGSEQPTRRRVFVDLPPRW